MPYIKTVILIYNINNPFKRPLLEQPDLVYVNSDNEFNKSYKIKQIL